MKGLLKARPGRLSLEIEVCGPGHHCKHSEKPSGANTWPVLNINHQLHIWQAARVPHSPQAGSTCTASTWHPHGLHGAVEVQEDGVGGLARKDAEVEAHRALHAQHGTARHITATNTSTAMTITAGLATLTYALGPVIVSAHEGTRT